MLPARARLVGRCVLIVEDNHDLRRLYAVGLSQRGFEIRLASNGAEAIERARTHTPDIILLDMILPIMNGWEVMDALDTPENPLRIPVIAISGQSPPESLALRKPLVDWLEKPVSLDELEASLNRHIAPQN